MSPCVTVLTALALVFNVTLSYSQKLIAHYNSAKKENFRIGTDKNDVLPYIQSGYTLMLPDDSYVKGVLIFLEDSGFDKRNDSAKKIYKKALKKDFAVLSVSTDIPFDFYFSETSILTAHQLIENVFLKHNLPNKNIFFLGASLTGHRAMRYIKHIKETEDDFQLNIKGIVVCNFTMDWTRKWHQNRRDLKISKVDFWEPKFINYMLETYLQGTPITNPEAYHSFSPYSYFDEENRNIEVYKAYAIRAYIEPAIKYRLKKHHRTLYENNATDIVGFLSELQLAGNDNTDLIVMQPKDNPAENKNAQSTWDAIDKKELIHWINDQSD
ncbi:MAG: hypothetical protein HRU50_00740 [Winogradskyella sp.]|nr:hypothetical protein [Winogradskyella sp.]